MAVRILLEIAVASVADARTAVAAGADRLEVCSALELEGLTPSVGLVQRVRAAVRVPIFAMIRPRPGGFCYSAEELAVMRDDVTSLLAAGADGVVFGALSETDSVNVTACRGLIDCCAGRPAVFHRAFGLAHDPFDAMEDIIDTGFMRILSAGGAASAAAGTERLRELMVAANGRIEVMPGGGIRAGNAGAIVRRSGCRQVHAGCRTTVPATGGPFGDFSMTDGAEVARLRAALDSADR
jgi:copper homeostasis protein